MTIYEFFVESTEAGVRLEVPHPGLSGSVDLMRRLDALVAEGACRGTGRNFGELATGLTVSAVRRLFEDEREVRVGQPGKPEPGPLRSTKSALDAVPQGTLFAAVFFEV